MATSEADQFYNLFGYSLDEYNRKQAEKKSSPAPPKTTTPSYSQPSTPSYSQPSTPSYSQPSTPSYSQPSSSGSYSSGSTAPKPPSSQSDGSGGIKLTRVGPDGKEHEFTVVNEEWAKFYEQYHGAQRVGSTPNYTVYQPPSNYGVDSQGRPLSEQQWMGSGGLLDLSGKNNVNTYKLSDGSYLDTTNMTPQQIQAATLWDEVKAGKRSAENAAAVLKGMGVDAYGNAVNPYYQGTNIYYAQGYVPPVSAFTGGSGVGVVGVGGSGGSGAPNTKVGAPPAGPANLNVSGTPGMGGQFTADQLRQRMAENSAKWQAASPAERERLHNENLALANLLGSSYNSQTGTYSGGLTGSQQITADQVLAAMAANGQDWAANSGNKAMQDAAHNRNTFLSDYFGLGGSYNAGTGVWNIGGSGGTPSGGGGGGTGLPVSDTGQPALPPTDPFQFYNNAVNQYGGAAVNPADPYWDSIRAIAESLGSQEYQQRKSSYENLVKNLTENQKADLDAVLANLNAAKNDLSNNTFQQWLEARQNLANRGLTGMGAGFQNDANTRLMLNQQNALGSLYADANKSIAKTNSDYGMQLADAFAQMAGLNETSLQQAQFQDMYKDASGNMLDLAKMYAQLAQAQMPYSQYDLGDLLQNQFNYDKLGVENKQFYDKLNAEGKQFYDKMKNDYGLEMTKLMGVDAQGNPTLDTRKLMAEIEMNRADLNEKIRHNRSTEAASAASNAIAAGRLQETINNNAARLKQAERELDLARDKAETDNDNTMMDRQLRALISEADNYGSYMKELNNVAKGYIDKGLTNDPAYKNVMKSLESVTDKYNDVLTGYEIVKSGGKMK